MEFLDHTPAPVEAEKLKVILSNTKVNVIFGELPPTVSVTIDYFQFILTDFCKQFSGTTRKTKNCPG